jgi:subtilase family serine protease
VPARGGAGLAIQVTETTSNIGTGTAPASTTSFYLSSNPVLETTDPVLGTRSIPELAPTATSTATTQFTLPTGLVPGSYTMFAVADGPGAVTESKEYNNSRLAFIQIGPDVTLTALTAPSTAGAGSTILVSDTTVNSGMGTAAASVTRFYLSADFSLDSSDTPLQARNVPSLDGAASSSGSTSVTIPSSTQDGVYYLIAKADVTDAVAECNETNNTRVWLIRIGPDLVVSTATAPARAAAGSSIDVTETTQNSGTGTAGASVTAIYLSTNALLDSGDQRLGTRSVPTLGPGGTSAKLTSVTLPAISAGTWYLIVSADDERTITETLETNNTRSISLLIGPDLTVASLSLPFTVVAGSTVSLVDSIKNVGAATAEATVVRFYLSTNTLFDSSDMLLGERSVSSIGAGLTNGGTTSVTVPTGLSGTYYLFAIADGANQVTEASEGNNSFLRIVQVTGGS